MEQFKNLLLDLQNSDLVIIIQKSDSEHMLSQSLELVKQLI